MNTTSRAIASLAAVVTVAAIPSIAAAAAPTDPQAGAQEPLRILRVGEALDRVARPLSDVPVLVADTGLDLQHPDIAPRLFSLPAAVAAPNPQGAADPGTVQAGAPGWDLIGSNAPPGLAPDADPDDPAGLSGHGTAVAGVLGAAQNNGQGGAGVAPNARFVALRTCWDGDQCFQFVQDDAIIWAADRGVRVVSFSWLSGPIEADLRAAIVDRPNVLFVTIPSGNGGPSDADPDDPQPCNVDAPNVLCVSTSAPDDGLDCGAFGPRSVDVAVPTRNSVTTTNGGGFGPTACATSFASPTAAGVATILFGIDPSASAADVKAAIVDSARKAPAWAGRSVSGGIADAAAAVELFQQRRGIAPATQPSDRTAPRLRLRVSRRVLRRLASAKRMRTTLVATLSEAATLRITLQRSQRGRRVGGRCRAATRRNRRAPSCVRHAPVASFTKAGLPRGTSRIVLRALDRRGRPLPPGIYRVVGRATDAAGNRSEDAQAKLRIKEARR